MSNKDNLNIRLNYRGGGRQLDRMNKDKLLSLKKALLYSYQSATAMLSDGREFRCLINPNKLSLDLDNKILSIPFKDVCLNAGNFNMEHPINQTDEGDWEEMEDLIATLVYVIEDQWEDMVSGDDINSLPVPEPDINIDPNEEVFIGIQEGDVFTWKENGSHWIVYLRRLEETAYFRADIRRCRYQLTLGNGSKYWVYVRGPVEQSILWTQTSGNYVNKLNYTLVLHIQKNEETIKYFNRFKKVTINNQPWEVQAVDSVSTPGIIEITLKETYNNTVETDVQKIIEKIEKKNEITESEEVLPYIHGLNKVYPYDIQKYAIKNYNNNNDGQWLIKNESRQNIVKILKSESNEIELSIITGKSGSFTLEYVVNEIVIANLNIEIGSL